MADDQNENDPESSTCSQLASSLDSDKDTKVPSTATSVQGPNEFWNRSIASSTGPRSLALRRSDHGFGFTLRHFIVYPPESNAILAGDRRLGIGNHVVGNEPMDTIFVKNVRENSPASEAGLTTGDRIISVNGQDIAGLAYNTIVELIHRTGNSLHLLVVPKENDLLQLYFSETAHNPETNQRLRVRSPDSTGSAHAKKIYTNSKPSGVHHYSRSETTPMFSSVSGSAEREHVTSPARAIDVRRSSEGNNVRRSKPAMNVCSRRVRDLCTSQAISDTSSCGSSESGGPSYGYGRGPPTCRLSLDADVGRSNNFDSLSETSVKDSYGSEDSLIMTRLRKSFEQKEEFLNRPLQTSKVAQNSLAAKEFYSRPQKLAGQTWPPDVPSDASTIVLNGAGVTKTQNRANFISSLDKINETTTSPQKKSVNTDVAEQPFQVVSVRTKQFENGAVEDKTELYRSELARLSTKHNVASVAVRKRDFENRAQIERQSFATRESRSLESAISPSTFYSTPGSGNRIIPIGSKNLHCEPPADFSSFVALSDDMKTDELLLQKCKPVVRQDSYLAACSKPTITISRKTDSNEDLSTTEEVSQMSSEKNNALVDDDKSTRRISYIRATGGDTMNVDNEYDLSDNDVTVLNPQRRIPRRWHAPLLPGEIQRLKKFFEDLAASSSERGILGFRKSTDSFLDQDQHSVVKEGALFCKVIQVEGKRAGDRSWKQLWVILRGPLLYLCKEKRESLSVHADTPATFDRQELGSSCDRIDIRRSVVEVACDYTKRKHVFRLNAPSVGAELLLQADDATSMTQWVKVLQEQAFVPATSNDNIVSTFSSNVSPSAGSKTFRKFTSLRNRSPTGPTGDSPNIKSKKTTYNETQQTSPKARTWKTKMARQFRKIQPGSYSPNTSAAVTYPAGATIGIPLELCPSSSFSEYVPLLVEMCTNIVEAKGLEIIGIYRVPGNSAAVSSLTEAVNRGLDTTIFHQDPRWSDVNVISSLLKSFFRKLPDALLTSELYPHFIVADRIMNPILRMESLRKLIHELPDHNFETLRYLLYHLKKIVANASVNKMEARNLAIVFGPNLVRNGDDMTTLVHDMSHQCRIVESLLSHVDWCFGDGNLADLKANIPDINSVPELDATCSNQDVLLENIRKIEASVQSPVTAKDIVSTIIGAANRKKQKTAKVSSSTRKVNSLSANISQIGSSSENILDTGSNYQNLKTRNQETKEVEKKPLVDQKPESEFRNATTKSATDRAETAMRANTVPNDPRSNTWTYTNLAATTQERVRRFEQETKAMLQRDLMRQKRASDFCGDDLNKERALTKNRNSVCSEKQLEQSTSSLLPDKSSDSTKGGQANCASKDPSICDNPPPVIVMRRNLPNVNGRNVTIKNDNSYSSDNNNNSNNDNNNNNNHNENTSNSLKRLKTSEEFVENNLLTKSSSLDSLHHAGRPSSHVSDDGGDLLTSLTTTFDRKLESLNKDVQTKAEIKEDPIMVKKRNSMNSRAVEDGSSFRDPSLHRTLERTSRVIEKQNKENDENDEKKDGEDLKEMRSCVTCGCSFKHSETVQQNCDNWRRTVLQETHPENRLHENVVRREPKLFYSSSVKLRRSESLKEGQGASTKLRRSGSLNKHETAKISKLESWILTRNAEATKLKRNDSLTKNEKTETNLMKRRQAELNKKTRSDKDGNGGCKTKRRTGTKNSSIKRRHTVGGTKDFDKVSWLQNQQRENNKENRKERRTSSPDLSSTRLADLLIEVVVQPRSIITIDRNLISRLLNVPLESQV